MNLYTKTQFIHSTALFAELTTAEATIIANELLEQIFLPKTTFIVQDDHADKAYFICDGSVRVYRLTEDGEEINIAILSRGDVVGEMALIDNTSRSANVEALQDTTVLSLHRNNFHAVLRKHPQTAISLLKIFASRVRKSNEYVEDVLSKNLTNRTLKMLQTLAQCFPNKEIALSQEEVATIIGATRARITEVLNHLQNEKKIALSHRKIQLL